MSKILFQVTPTSESGAFQLVISCSLVNESCSPLGLVIEMVKVPVVGDRKVVVVFIPIVLSTINVPDHGSL